MKKVMLILMLVAVGASFMLVLNLAVNRNWITVKGTEPDGHLVFKENGNVRWVEEGDTGMTDEIILVDSKVDMYWENMTGVVEEHLIEFTTQDGSVALDITDDGVLYLNYDCNDIEAGEIVTQCLSVFRRIYD